MAGMVIKCCIIALVSCIVVLILKELRLEWSGLSGLLGGVILALTVCIIMEEIMTKISPFVVKSGLEKNSLHAILKCIGITFLVDFISGFCRSQGQLSIALALEMVGRISICVIALPFAMDLLNLANQILFA